MSRRTKAEYLVRLALRVAFGVCLYSTLVMKRQWAEVKDRMWPR